MKKLLFVLMLAFLFTGCEKEEPFINGGWTLYLTNPTGNNISWYVCFDVETINKEFTVMPTHYFCDEWSCDDLNCELTMFDYRCHDSTLLIKTVISSGEYAGNYMYYGKYYKEKDMFIGATDYVYPDKPGAYYMCSNNDSITRGMIYR